MVEEFEFGIGDKVRFEPVESFFEAGNNKNIGKYFPKVGTVGTVVGHSAYNIIHTELVQWPEGETVHDGRWFVRDKHLRKVD